MKHNLTKVNSGRKGFTQLPARITDPMEGLAEAETVGTAYGSILAAFQPAFVHSWDHRPGLAPPLPGWALPDGH